MNPLQCQHRGGRYFAGLRVRALIRAALALASLTTGGYSAAAQGDGGGQLTAEQRKLADDCETLRRGTIIKSEEQLRGLRSGQLETKDNAGTIRTLEADIAALKARGRVIVPTLHFPVSVGQIGRLPGTGGYVEQILGAHEMLLRCSFRVQVVVTRHYRRASEMVKRPVVFKIHGLPTKDYSQGSDAELLEVFRVARAENYQAADGQSVSQWVLEPFDMRPIENYLRALPQKP